ncbi:hypothetical protein ASD69_16720 [Lysobacter sp. Root604]|nr:hypothetical protein ASD69_16720 [Lysobacter sp. Root604]
MTDRQWLHCKHRFDLLFIEQPHRSLGITPIKFSVNTSIYRKGLRHQNNFGRTRDNVTRELE